MKEKTLCIVTPDSRCYYRAIPLAKEFLDKDHNLINTTGQRPDGEIIELESTPKPSSTTKTANWTAGWRSLTWPPAK